MRGKEGLAHFFATGVTCISNVRMSIGSKVTTKSGPWTGL